jgi:NADH dehydrogenase
MDASATKKRILILGGGFGGVATAHHLEGLFRRRPDVEIVLVSRDNFLLMTPLLFEVFSGALDLRDCSFPVRAFLSPGACSKRRSASRAKGSSS